MKKNLKCVMTLVVLCTILTGCNKDTKIETDREIMDTNVEIDSNNTQKIEVEQNISDNTKKEFMYHKEAKNTIEEYISNEDYESIKREGKKYIVTAVDFIFFDKPINGYYFKELPNDIKEEVLDTMEYIDSVIIKYDPDYKESLEEKYKIASEFIHDKYLYALDTIREYLGNEDYESLIRIKDKVKEDLGEILSNGSDFIKDKANKGKEYVKEKYIKWRDN